MPWLTSAQCSVNPASTSPPSARHGRTAPACRTRRGFLAAALALVGLPGCGGSPAPLLRVASHVWPGYETLPLARQMGWLDEGAVRLVELLSATDSLLALNNGSVEAAALTLDEVLAARAQGLELRVPMIFNISAGADALIARPEIDSLPALAGKRVGVEHSAVGALMLAEVLRRADLPRSALHLVPLTIDAHRQAYLDGRVDALVTYQPTLGQLERAGARRLFDSAAIPGRIVDVLAITPAALERSREGARQLVAAHFRALAWLRDHPADAHARMAQRLGLDADSVAEALAGLELPDLDGNRRWLLHTPAHLDTVAAELAALMWRERLLPRETGGAGLAYAGLLPA